MFNINSKIEEIIKKSTIDFESIAKVIIRSLILFIIVLVKDFY